MAEEMVENAPWESEEADYPESEEAIEAEESGEAYRSRKRKSRPFKAQQGVKGMTLRSQDGRARTLQFPASLATVSETNRGLATQELGRRELDERLERLEQKFKSQQKKDVATSAVVTLALSGGLSTVGAFQVANEVANQGTSSTSTNSALSDWAKKSVTKMATVASLTQLATSGAKLAFNGRYIKSGFGITADVFSVLQLGLFTFGSLQQTPKPSLVELSTTAVDPTKLATYSVGTKVFDITSQKMYLVISTTGGNYYQLVS